MNGPFVVVRRGIYDQGVVAVCDSIDEAKARAEKAAKLEPDLYHDFEVRAPGENGEFNRVVRSLSHKDGLGFLEKRKWWLD